MTTISASDARQTLPAQLDRVEAGEEIAITRHGRVVALLVPPESRRRQRAEEAWAAADRIGDRIAAARNAPPAPAIDPARAEELVEAVREERRAR